MIITIANHKGGVGKTALAAHLLYFAGEAGLKALGVDLDSQANLTGTFVDRDAVLDGPNAAQLFGDKPPAPIATPTANVSLMPASPGLNDVDKGSMTTLFNAKRALRAFGDQFDLVVIDTPPALGLRVLASLASSDRVIAPLLPERYGTDGLNTLLNEVAQVRANLNTALAEPEFVFNLVNRTAKTHQAIIAELRKIFPTRIPTLYRHIAVADALSEGRPVWRNATHAGAAQEWRETCAAVLELDKKGSATNKIAKLRTKAAR